MASELDQALGIVHRAAAWHVGLEGANTSFQVHLRVDPDRFADHFNAAQLATGPVLAVAGNSPTFCGHRLWQETAGTPWSPCWSGPCTT